MHDLQEVIKHYEEMEEVPEDVDNIYERLKEAHILDALYHQAPTQALKKIEKRTDRLDLDEIIEFLYFWIHQEYMRSGRFGEVTRMLEQAYHSDFESQMPALSLALNVLHTSGRVATDYADLDSEKLDELSNISREEIADYAKKLGIKTK